VSRNTASRAYNVPRAAVGVAAGAAANRVQNSAAVPPFANGNTGVAGRTTAKPSNEADAGTTKFNSVPAIAAMPSSAAAIEAVGMTPQIAAGGNNKAGGGYIGAVNPAAVAQQINQAFAGAAQVAQGQAAANAANHLQNAANAVAAVPPKVVNAAPVQAVLNGLPPQVGQAAVDIAGLPQQAANFPVKAFVKPKIAKVQAAAGQGQLINGAFGLGQQVLPIVLPLPVPQQQPPNPNPGGGGANNPAQPNPGGVAGAILVAERASEKYIHAKTGLIVGFRLLQFGLTLLFVIVFEIFKFNHLDHG
jgi:hypothetical protein